MDGATATENSASLCAQNFTRILEGSKGPKEKTGMVVSSGSGGQDDVLKPLNFK